MKTFELSLADAQTRLLSLLPSYDRIAIGGSPRSGKTTAFAALVTDREIVHTDRWLDRGWDEAARRAARAARMAGPRVLVEGVRATRVVLLGFDAQIFIWLPVPLVRLDAGQHSMRHSRQRSFEKWRASNTTAQVEVWSIE